PRGSFSRTVEVLLEAFRNWGVDVVLGLSVAPERDVGDMGEPGDAIHASIADEGRSAVDRLDRWEDDGGVTAPSRGLKQVKHAQPIGCRATSGRRAPTERSRGGSPSCAP